MKNKSILITGAGGMLGSDIANQLAANCSLLGLGRHEAPHLNIPYRITDISIPAQLSHSLENFKPDIIFHCAAMTQVDLCESERENALTQNVTSVQNVVKMANEYSAQLIFFSTDYIFNGKLERPYREIDPSEPINFYGETKQMAENYIHQNADNYIVFRVAWLYGRHGKCFPNSILKLASEKNVIPVVADQVGHPTWTADLAWLMQRMLEKELLKPMNKQIYHLANEGAVSWADFARFILQTAGIKNVKIESISSKQLTRPAKRPMNSRLDTSKIKAASGIALRHWGKAAKDYLTQIMNSKK